jgi:hypothetical protein
VPVLDGSPPAEWRRSVLLSHGWGGRPQADDFDLLNDAVLPAAYVRLRQPTFDGVRTSRYSYARMFDGTTALYDHSVDSIEHVNVAGSKPAAVAHLNTLLDELLACSGRSCRVAENKE